MAFVVPLQSFLSSLEHNPKREERSGRAFFLPAFPHEYLREITLPGQDQLQPQLALACPLKLYDWILDWLRAPLAPDPDPPEPFPDRVTLHQDDETAEAQVQQNPPHTGPDYRLCPENGEP